MVVAVFGGEVAKESGHKVGFEPVKVVLTVAAEFDQARHVEQLQVMAYGRLLGVQQATERGDIHFAFLGECEHEPEARFIRKQFEDLGQIARATLKEAGQEWGR